MAKDKTDFLKFSAYSMKDLITRKLSETTAFTDQIYEGSNLAILIDLVSYMYQCLVYCLNNAASESMFEDTQIYSNISRLVNLIGYHPRGCYPSTFSAYIQSTGVDQKIVMPYTCIDTGLTDSTGRSIFFSTKRVNLDVENKNSIVIEKDNVLNQTFYNGKWQMYQTIFTSSGGDNQTFVLDGLKSDSAENAYVANDFIDVLVYDPETGIGGFWNRDVNGLFTNSSNVSLQTTTNTTIYGANSKTFDLRLNQDKTYEIRFGDGIVGEKPPANSKIIIFYLNTNGPDGQIDLENIDLASVKLEYSAASLGISQDMFNLVSKANYESYESDMDIANNGNIYTITAENGCVTKFTPEEGVSDIQANAPNWFKLGNRLITRKDYEYFIKNSPQARECIDNMEIVDVKCMNNIEYVSTFYKWLYMWGKKYFNDGRHYFNTSFWQRTNYKQIDPADANNTYLWIKAVNPSYDDQLDSYNVDSAERLLNNILQPMKTMTTEIQVVKPVIVNFDICACPDLDYVRNQYLGSTRPIFDENCESYIEVTLDDNTLYVSTTIQQQIYNIILDKFDAVACRLGQHIEYYDILDKIYAIPGVKRIRTVFMTEDATGPVQHSYDGLSFATWSSVLSDGDVFGVDLEVGNSVRHLEEFQFPRFIGKTKLKSRIQIIKKSMTTINTIKM